MTRHDLVGQNMLIYTTEQGGYFKGLVDGNGKIRHFSRQEFDDLVSSRSLDVTNPWDQEKKTIVPVLVALARIEDAHDFLL